MSSKFICLIKNHAFFAFLLLTILISWGPWIMLGQRMLVFGPSIAGIILIYITKGKEGLQDITKQVFRNKAHISWWLLAFFIPFVIVFVAIGTNAFMGYDLPEFEFFKSQWYLITLFFLITIIGGPLGEEFGWRGFSIPYLQEKTTPLITALIIGVAWGIWHIPEFFSQGAVHYQIGAIYIPLFILCEVALSVIMTWIYNKTKYSLLIAGILFHNSENFWSVALTTNKTIDTILDGQVSINMNIWIISIILYILFAIVLVLITKGRLGYVQDCEKLLVIK